MTNNAWRLYQKVVPNMTKEPLLNFTRQLVLHMIKKHRTFTTRPGPVMTITGHNVQDELRFNKSITYFIKKGKIYDQKCKVCKKKTVWLCQMCDVPLHPDHFIEYHTVSDRSNRDMKEVDDVDEAGDGDE